MQDLHAGWGEKIDEELRRQGRSRAWLAREIEVHPSTITRIIAGSLCPNDEMKWKIAGALGERMDVLWAWPRIVPPAKAAC